MTPARGLLGLFLLAAAVGSSGCKRRPHVEGTVAAESVTKAWTADGFDTTSVVNVEAEGWSAGACSQGTVSGLDVLICEFDTDGALGTGSQKISAGWEEESVPTGALVRTTQPSRTVLAIADRTKSDPNGRTIARLAKTFQAQSSSP
jgi:hypothetical protein